MSTTPNDPGDHPTGGSGSGQPPNPPPPPPGGWQPPPPPGQPGGWQQPPPPPGQPGGWQQPPPPQGGWQQPGGAGQWQQPAASWQQPGGYGSYQQPYSGGGTLATWGLRAGATIVDYLVLLIPSLIIRGATSHSVFAGIVVDLLIRGAYDVLLIGGNGRTVGMRAVGTYVVDARTGGSISYGRAMGRWASQLVLSITIIGGILDILWPLWDGQNQTIHDKMAGTVVLRSR